MRQSLGEATEKLSRKKILCKSYGKPPQAYGKIQLPRRKILHL